MIKIVLAQKVLAGFPAGGINGKSGDARDFISAIPAQPPLL